MKNSNPPGLYIVASPIGNLSDLTPRAAAVLGDADIVLAEDKRVTGKLLRHIDARPESLWVYNDHSDADMRRQVIETLSEKIVALVSDAGTPLISDPGYKLVRDARRMGAHVTTLPGPSAPIAALTLSGLPSARFLFAGFLPSKSKARRDEIAALGGIDATLLLFESGPRLAACLRDLAEVLGPRDGAVVREISKLHEETVTGSLSELAAHYDDAPPKGEIVIVVGPPPEAAPASEDDLDAALDEAMTRLSASRAAADVAARLGIPRKRAYARALEKSGGR